MLKPWYHHPLVQVFFTLVVALILRTFLFSTYVVVGPSMEDSLHTGDLVLVWKGPQTIGRGDVVMLKRQIGDLCLVKRVVALPGEVVEIRGNTVLVNDQPFTLRPAGKPGSYEMGPVQVPPEGYFVLGDNRDMSSDSHVFGPVTRDQIVGKALVRLWPPDKAGGIP